MHTISTFVVSGYITYRSASVSSCQRAWLLFRGPGFEILIPDQAVGLQLTQLFTLPFELVDKRVSAWGHLEKVNYVNPEVPLALSRGNGTTPSG